MPRTKGFSLIELLIVVAIILIIAAIAIPNLLRAKMAANESSAVASLRTINTAMTSYFSAFPTTGYAANLAALGPGAAVPCVATIASACLIDSSLASGTKNGFNIAATGGNTVNGVTFNYYSTATPVTLHGTGDRSFCGYDDSVVRFDPSGILVASRNACAALSPIQ
jgi:type IV pilus assembly protein PilA